MKTFVLKHKETGKYFAGFEHGLGVRPAVGKTWSAKHKEAIEYTEEQFARLQTGRPGKKLVSECIVMEMK